MKRIIIHSDLNNFFASVECMKRPWLWNVPMAVTGDSEQRHGIILAKNRLAASHGIKTGEPIWRSFEKCPDLVTVSPEFDDYIVISERVRKIYEKYSCNIESFGIDECWIDVSNIAQSFDDGKRIADNIRAEIRDDIGVTASCGVSYNKIFAKLASDIKKPDATTVIDNLHYKDIVWNLPAENLLFVGRSTKRSLASLNIRTIGDIAKTDIKTLSILFGKCGASLWYNANGMDPSPVCTNDTVNIVSSVSNSVTVNHDIIGDEDIRVVLYVLCEKISSRLRRLHFLCSTLKVHVKDNTLRVTERQLSLPALCRTTRELFDAAFSIFKQNEMDSLPIRALGIHASNLRSDNSEQLSVAHKAFEYQKHEQIDNAADAIRQQYGKASLMRGILLTENVLSNIEVSEEKCSFSKR